MAMFLVLPTENEFNQFTTNNEIIIDSLFAMRNDLEVNDIFEASLLGQKKELNSGCHSHTDSRWRFHEP